jgi:IS30 family transposase
MPVKAVTADLEEIREALRNAKSAERPKRKPSLREAVQTLLPEIEDLRKAKWSDADIAEWFGKRGLNISAGTLAQYIREARKSGPQRATSKAASVLRERSIATAKNEGKASPNLVTAGVPTSDGKGNPDVLPSVAPIISPNLAGATTKRRVNDDA